MSILIKGMEMPTSCAKCKLNNDARCVLINGCTYDESNGLNRRPDCPLVPLPPHGDLIDKKTVSENLAKVMSEKKPPFSYPDWNDAVIAVLTAPTIIEAEEGEI